ncbi:MAG TPA: hypothetical protein VGJ71_14515 [Candidatus Limnocylindrales bacterium]|jgi:hypothetical protein
MSDALDEVLRLVADGRLTAAEAAPILDALSAADEDEPFDGEPDAAQAPDETPSANRAARSIRIQVNEGGRQVLNLRVPVSLGRFALDRIPGLSGSNVDMVRRALSEGRSGTLLHIDDEDDGVRIALE